MPDALELRLEAWDRTPPGIATQIELNRHGVAEQNSSWKASTSHGIVAVAAGHLPFTDGTFDAVQLADLLEYVRDEESVLLEIARVLSANGRLTILAPFHGATTWLDGTNWHRYLHDLRGSDTLLPELAESGWRRRYRKSDLEALLNSCGFEMASIDQRGTGISELGWFIGRLLEVKQRTNMVSAEVDLVRIRYAARSLDRRVPMGPIGSWLIVDAVKR